jgi:L-fuconolactonase
MTLPARICDPHHHLWNLSWSHYLVDDLRGDLATVPNVVRTMFVECGAWYRAAGPQHLLEVGETEWVVANATAPGVLGAAELAGIVGAIDLRLGARTQEAIDAHIAAADGRFRGIRHRATWDASSLIPLAEPDPGPGLLRDPAFRRGFAAMHARGLVFDAWMYFPQLGDLVDLARAFPDTTIVLNHLGGPITVGPYGDRDAMSVRWRELMADVARCSNIMLKVGGIGMPMYGVTWHKQPERPSAEAVATVWRERVRWCIEQFGVDRCMFESNFPVDRLGIDYATLWDAFDLMTGDLSPDERDALFHDTACRTYRLPM